MTNCFFTMRTQHGQANCVSYLLLSVDATSKITGFLVETRKAEDNNPTPEVERVRQALCNVILNAVVAQRRISSLRPERSRGNGRDTNKRKPGAGDLSRRGQQHKPWLQRTRCADAGKAINPVCNRDVHPTVFGGTNFS
jgi:hypothetical protein